MATALFDDTADDWAARRDIVTTAVLASTDAGKGAALFSYEDGLTGQEWRQARRRRASLDEAGIVLHTAFDANGEPTGTIPDHAPALQQLADNLSALGGGVIDASGSVGALILGASVILPLGVSIIFPSARKRPVRSSVIYWNEALRVMPHPAGIFHTGVSVGATVSVAANGHCQAGYLFFGNMDPDVSVTDFQYAGGIPDVGVGELRNIRVDGSSTGGISVFRGAGCWVAEDWAGDNVATAYSLVPSLYTDKKHAKRFHFYTRANATSPLIDVRGTGDAMDIGVVDSGNYDNGSSVVAAEGVWTSNARGGRLFGLINGIHRINGSILDISGMHIELGQFVLDGFQGRIHDGQLFNGGGMLDPIVVKSTAGANGDRRSFSFGNLIFSHQINWLAHSATGWSATEKLDILLDTGAGAVDVIDEGTSQRVAAVNSALDKTTILAPRIGDSSGTLSDLRNYGPMLQRKNLRINNGKIAVTGVMEVSGTLGAITATSYNQPAGVSGLTFKGATGTYHYQAQVVFDPVRKIGRGITGSPAAVSVAAVNGANAVPQITFDLSAMTYEGGYLIRLYRGSADGTYDKYVDIPAIALKYGFDDGNCFASIPWVTRTAGAVDTLNTGFSGIGARLIYESGFLVAKGISGSTVPTVGTWKQSDKTELLAQVADANNMVLEGSTCTVAGTAGTWVARRFSTVSPAT